MSSVPDVSVIVPVFNQEAFLARCLRSLLAQDMSEELFEIVVVDDGSDDATTQILDLFRDQVRVLRNEQNCGLPAALNRGIRASRSRYVVRVDSDDYVNAKFLTFMHSFLFMNPAVDAVSCDYLIVDDAEVILERKNCSEDPIGCGIMFRTEDLVEIGLYDETFLRHEDRDLRLRFLKKFNIQRLELPLYRYRRHTGNITNDDQAMARHLGRLVEKHGDELV